MLRYRLIVSLLLFPPGLASIFLGGVWYFLVLLCFFVPASYEYSLMMKKGGYRPALPLIVGGTFLLAFAHAAPTFWAALQPNAGLITGGTLAFDGRNYLSLLAGAGQLVFIERFFDYTGGTAPTLEWAHPGDLPARLGSADARVAGTQQHPRAEQ